MVNSLADLHCDTFEVLFDNNADMKTNSFHISLDRAKIFNPYIQVAAVWSDSKFSDKVCLDRFIQTVGYMNTQLNKYSYSAVLCHDFSEIKRVVSENKAAFILAVEDARILCGDISNADVLYKTGVRFLTLTWSGETIIGGSHDTCKGLTEFGGAVVKRCFELGIIPDISHASREVTNEVLAIAKSMNRPVIATHSNSYTVRAHSRNLTDDEFCRIIKNNGIAGISFAANHLTDTDICTCDISSVISHIRHYFNLGGENHVSLGCDFDGIDLAPRGLEDISQLGNLAAAMKSAGFSDEQIQKVFFLNAYNFMKNNL